MTITRQKITRWEKGGAPSMAMDDLAVEEPLEIRIENQPVTVTMRTPGHDEELAAGFLLGEGIIRRHEEILKIAPHPRATTRNVIGAFLAPHKPLDLKSLTRHFYASSSCGVCGKAGIESIRRHFSPVKSKIKVRAEVLLQLPEKLRRSQETFSRTGGLHAAALFDLNGNLLVSREDVGRHNAVDKVLGYALLNGRLPLDKHILLVSGRVSFEIAQKALAGSVAIVAAVSAPSSLAVEFAKENGQTLVGFVRSPRLNIYSHRQRVIAA